MIPSLAQGIFGSLLVLSSLGVILATKPVYSALSFLLTLLTLAVLYLELSAQFIAVMQILVYAGAILVIFMFVIVLFQDAHQQIAKYSSRSPPLLLLGAAAAFVLSLLYLGSQFFDLKPATDKLPADFGTVQELGKALYIDFFFPFEAVTLLFLVAVIGALYIGRKST